MDLKYANIGIAVAAAIIFGGGFLFRSAGEGALQAVMLVALIAAFGTHHLLDERNKARERREGKEPQ